MQSAIVSTAVFVVVGAAFVALGQPLAMRKIAPNGIYGVRTPTTLRSESIWYLVNERAGRQLRALGALIVGLALIFHLAGMRPNGPLGLLIIVGGVAIAISSQSFADKLRAAELRATSDQPDSR